MAPAKPSSGSKAIVPVGAGCLLGCAFDMILILLGAILEFGLPATNCTACTNERNNYMEQNNLVCDEYPSAYTRFCKQNANWAKQKFCQRSC